MEKQYKRILVIKLRHLGDVLLSTPVFTNLQEFFPDALIDAYIWREAEDILLGHPAIAGFHFYERSWKKLPLISRLRKEFTLLWQIKKNNYDLVINLTEGDRGAIASFASRAERKVGVDPGKKITRKIYTDLVKPCPTTRHAVERDLDAIRKIGIYPSPADREPFFYLTRESEEIAQELTGEEPYIVMQASARWRFKCPPPSLMAAILNRLGKRAVLTGALSERDYVQSIVDLTQVETLNLAGMTTLKEMGAVMQHSLGLITVDSVALHMASALKVPVVVLFGPTSEENWGPWMHPRAEVVAQNYPCRPCRLDGCGGSKMSDCLWTLSPDRVVAACERVFRQVSLPSKPFVPLEKSLHKD